MGLNLNIHRIVFSTLQKFDGTAHRTLTPSEIKQIAGRAGKASRYFPHCEGRYKSKYSSGKVTSLYNRDMPLISRVLNAPLPQVDSKVAMILPLYEQVVHYISPLTVSLRC